MTRPQEKNGTGPRGGHAASLGPIESKARSDVAALVTEHPMGEALAETAYHLARFLDSEKAGMATAAVARQLVATLAELASYQVRGDEDELGDLLSTPVRDPED